MENKLAIEKDNSVPSYKTQKKLDNNSFTVNVESKFKGVFPIFTLINSKE